MNSEEYQKGRTHYFPCDEEEFNEFIKELEMIFEDEKVMKFWLHSLQDYSERQIERIHNYEVKYEH